MWREVVPTQFQLAPCVLEDVGLVRVRDLGELRSYRFRGWRELGQAGERRMETNDGISRPHLAGRPMNLHPLVEQLLKDPRDKFWARIPLDSLANTST